MQLIAKELKTGATLQGSFDQESFQAWMGSFANKDFYEAHGEPDIELSDFTKSQLRLSTARAQIDQTAEPMTREGVISDVSAVLVVGLAQIVKALSSAKDMAEVKSAVAGLQPFADAVLGKLATPTDMKDPQGAIQAGKVVMPYMVKGDAAKVVKDMGELANGVSAALLASRKAA